jgi:hypothetical protein
MIAVSTRHSMRCFESQRSGMRVSLIVCILVSAPCLLIRGQTRNAHEVVVLAMEAEEIQVAKHEDGSLRVQVRPGDLRSWKARGHVRYSDLGAKGMAKPMTWMPSRPPMQLPTSLTFR